MADRRTILHDDLVTAGNHLTDMLDFLRVVSRALILDDDDHDPDPAVTTVLAHVIDLGMTAQAATSRAIVALWAEAPHG